MNWITLEYHGEFQDNINKHLLQEIKKVKFWKSIEILKHDPVFTVNDVIEVLDIDTKSILKSLFFQNDLGSICLVNLCGQDRADMEKIKNEIGCKEIKLLNPKSIYINTKLPLGAISPLVYSQPPILIDNMIKENKYCYMGTGLNNYSFRIITEKFKEIDYLIWGNYRVL